VLLWRRSPTRSPRRAPAASGRRRRHRRGARREWIVEEAGRVAGEGLGDGKLRN